MARWSVAKFKSRCVHFHAGHTWEVDIFHGDNEGLVVAEIELESEETAFELPHWICEEVSGDSKYYNSSLLDNPFKHWQ